MARVTITGAGLTRGSGFWAVARLLALLVIAVLAGQPLLAQEERRALLQEGMSHYGMPGHLEMPSARALPDGTFAFTITPGSHDVWRSSMVFQITPRLTGAFRYSYVSRYFGDGQSLYDRSFDLRYQLLQEDPHGWRPALAVGLQDFGGTGIFGAEYLVATKGFGPVTASAGIGWGRLGSYNSFSNPFGLLADGFRPRPESQGIADTGKVSFDRFFRGDAALFLAADWQVNDRLSLSLEYSSDAMRDEAERIGFEHKTPINLGLDYRLGDRGRLGMAVLYGSALVLNYQMALDPARPSAPSGYEAGPPAVMPGLSRAAAASWGSATTAPEADVRAALAAQGVALEGLHIEGTTAHIAITNTLWPAVAQSWGRTARVLSAHLPAGVTTFRIRSHLRDMPMREITLTRADLEELEYAPDGAWQAWVRADIRDASALPDQRGPREEPFSWRLLPYIEPGFFDPDSPLRLDLGAELTAEWTPMRGLWVSGGLRQKLVGNLDEATRLSDSILPHVRSDASLYAKQSGPSLRWLTAEYFTRPGENLYARASLGLLEQMYGGLSAEVLWAPPDRPYALGLEVNYVAQRDYDGFGFLDYRTTTGHVSGSYDLGRGYQAQLDIGRYLAGDWGATATMTRRFGNGFEVGAFFTLTDVSFDDFGEGAFDKGITISMPLTWILGEPGQTRAGTTIRPIQRDGGARLSLRNRLYELTRDERDAARGQRWGRFWR
ncbi:YjbH domain-containing protein [Xinfangfangia sp. D13-10-4-6]|uniref:YjbH domain-containing protein n=1 Tax=Pseudogemmobacter hezensis TaxID=2737662 RepID=UPI001556F4AA|nr:YjbH domain-containing protein [Pseudogemmobacter hezensis]NPD16313.1 YjbH domain-containing protein [Pseudogemmobacter hezensis]